VIELYKNFMCNWFKSYFEWRISWCKILSVLMLVFDFLIGSAQTNSPTSSGIVPGATGTTTPFVQQAYPTNLLKNYVRTWTPRQPIAIDATVTGNSNVNQVNMQTQYLDGLGRPQENVVWQGSPAQTDMVSPVLYDGFGREQYKYLPYTSTTTDGSFQLNPYNDQSNFYGSTYPGEQPAISGERFFYSHVNFEPSPLSRVFTSFSPGNSWAGSEGGSSEKSIQSQYLVNSLNDSVLIWTITFSSLTYSSNDVSTNIPTTSAGNFYPSGTLYKSVTIDERGNAMVDYRDIEGRLILKKSQIDATIASDLSGYTGFLCTYYIYDDLNHLRFVIPPKATALLPNESWQIDETTINELCFRYEFDYRGRMMAKKIPGAGWEYEIYDMGDKSVFTQDGNMRNNNQWLGTLYDGLDRNVETGMLTYIGLPSALQNFVTSATTNASPVPSTSTTSGTSPSSIPPNLDVVLRNAGQTLYQASNTITFEPGFSSETGAIFVAEIEMGNSGNFTNSITVYNNPLPTGSGDNFIPLTITNFDNYNNTAKGYNLDNNNKLTQATNIYADPLKENASIMTQGLQTSGKVRVIENPADLTLGQWLETAIFYDDKGRTQQTQYTNYKGGLDLITTMYDFLNEPVCTYQVHNNASAGINNERVMTAMVYDHEERLISVSKNINDDNNPSSPQTTQRLLSSNTYDALGKLKEKKIGQQSVFGSGPSTNPIEDDNYAYNIRGWLKGVNWQGYGGSSSTSPTVNTQSSKWFGMDLSYDWGFSSNQFNGNISGQRWMSGSDGYERSFGYGYDNLNRILFSDFNQNFGGSWSKNDPSDNFNINFSGTLGDGINYSSAYDGNGNIIAMQQYGLVLNSSQVINSLTYNYNSSSNKLANVTDGTSLPSKVSLGNFIDNNKSGDDYGYDVNGNLITDKNKFINGSTGIDQTTGGGIVYNHLNLPYQISMQNSDGSGKGTITYIYDAIGNKLEKRTNELASSFNNNTAAQTITSYLENFVYQNNILQFFSTEEGRVRPITPNSYNNNEPFAFDYLIKDHLGNTRMVLTDELEEDIYPAATLETAGITLESTYYNINTADIVANPPVLTTPTNQTYQNNNGIDNGDPAVTPSSTSEQMYRLNAATGDNMGLGITLKVMAGDNVAIYGKSIWQSAAGLSNGGSYNIVINNLLTLLAGTSAVASSQEGATASGLINSSVTPEDLNSLFSNKPDTTPYPKAYINWILFDENFRPVQSSSGFDAVSATAGLRRDHSDAVSITKSGFLYVYCSNESNVDVFFDNLQVILNRGPLREANNYYPFGLAMAGISDETLKTNYAENKFRFNKGSELEHKEFSDGTGLEMYEANLRTLDPQLGRWWQIDSKPDFAQSLYSAMGNNPILLNDPLGDSIPGCSICSTDIPIAKESTKPRINFLKPGEKTEKRDAAFELTVTRGYQIAAKIGKVGVDVNFGSKEVAKGTDINPVKNVDPNKTISGGGVGFEFVNFSREESSTTQFVPAAPNNIFHSQDVNVTTIEATNTISLFSVANFTRTWRYSQSDALGQEGVMTPLGNTGTQFNLGGDINSIPIKGTKFSIGLIYRINVTINFQQVFKNIWTDINTGGN
jgi:RHS repeat-associated protein